MQVKRFEYGGDAGYGGGFDGSGSDGSSSFGGGDGQGEAPGSGTSAGYGTPGGDGQGEAPGSGASAGYGTPGADTGAMANANAAADIVASYFGADQGAPSYSGGSGADSGGSGAGSGIDFVEPPTPTPTTPTTNIDNLKPQYVNPKDFRSSINSLTPTTDPYAHYKNYNDADYNYLRTPSMPVRNTTTPLPSNTAPSNIAPSNTSMTDFFNDLRKNNLNTGQINREYGRPENFGSEGSYIQNNNLAQGGIAGITPQSSVSSLGGYARGGMPRLLDGPGDGMSDNIPATINDRQPARLADGEFVIPADVVSHLGNGSTKAGSKRLHLMMDQVRQARTGNPKQGKRINPNKFMPK